MPSRTPKTFVPATNVKKPNARRGSMKSWQPAERNDTKRQMVRAVSTTKAATQTASSTEERASNRSSFRPTEMIPLAMTRAK